MLGLVLTPDKKMYRQDFSEPIIENVGKVVGGYVEHATPMYLPRPYCLLIDEEGKLKRKPVNPVASAWYSRFDPIVGTAVVMKDGWVDGERDIVGLTDDECLKLIGYVSETSFGEYRFVELQKEAVK